MKRLLCVLGLAAALSLTWGGSAFATDQDTFNKLIAKVAPTEETLFFTSFNPKLACTCLSSTIDPSVVHEPGIVVLANPTQLDCAHPRFNTDGSFSSLSFCNGDFAVVH